MTGTRNILYVRNTYILGWVSQTWGPRSDFQHWSYSTRYHATGFPTSVWCLPLNPVLYCNQLHLVFSELLWPVWSVPIGAAQSARVGSHHGYRRAASGAHQRASGRGRQTPGPVCENGVWWCRGAGGGCTEVSFQSLLFLNFIKMLFWSPL